MSNSYNISNKELFIDINNNITQHISKARLKKKKRFVAVICRRRAKMKVFGCREGWEHHASLL